MTLSVTVRILCIALLGIAAWSVFGAATGVAEPWDAGIYWTLAYPALLLASGLAGAWLRRRAWLAGLVLTLAQLPVMLVQTQAGAMALFALALLAALAVPAMLATGLGGRLAARHG